MNNLTRKELCDVTHTPGRRWKAQIIVFLSPAPCGKVLKPTVHSYSPWQTLWKSRKGLKQVTHRTCSPRVLSFNFPAWAHSSRFVQDLFAWFPVECATFTVGVIFKSGCLPHFCMHTQEHANPVQLYQHVQLIVCSLQCTIRECGTLIKMINSRARIHCHSMSCVINQQRLFSSWGAVCLIKI